MEYLNKTQKSMIYEYFHSTEKYTFRCPNCGEYYDYGTNNIIKIDLDKVRNLRDSAFPELANQMLTIEECLQYYVGSHQVRCKYCGNLSINKYIEFCHPAKVLIFSFTRNNNPNNCVDFDFGYELDMSSYFCKRANDYNTIPYYKLKACISRGVISNNIPNQRETYIADCFVKDDNMETSNWYKFSDEKIIPIEGYYYPKNAPIMLMYEIDKSYNEKQSNNKDNLFNPMNNSENNPNMNNNNQNNINLNNDMNNNMNYNNNYMNNNIQYNPTPNANNENMNYYNMNNGNNNNYNMNNNNNYNNYNMGNDNMNNINLNNNINTNQNMINMNNNNNMNNNYMNNNNMINNMNNNMNSNYIDNNYMDNNMIMFQNNNNQ
jgi:hypothetical protein